MLFMSIRSARFENEIDLNSIFSHVKKTIV